MRHFDITRWTDFVRGTLEPGARAPMEKHLETGCGRCGRIVAALERLVAEAAAKVAPPDYAERSVKAFFALNRPQPESILRKLVLRSTFDSRLEPATVPVRGEAGEARHLRLESEEFLLDLRLEREGRRQTTLVEGQIVRRDGAPMANAPTYLVSDGGVQPRGFTDEIGAFGFELRSGLDAELWLGADEKRLLVVDLPAAD